MQNESQPLIDPARTAQAVALINSSNVAAVGLALSLRRIGWSGPVLCFNDRRQPWIADFFPHACAALECNIAEPEELPDLINRRIPPETPKVLFFCTEALYPLYASPDFRRKVPNLAYRLGPATGLDLDLVLDRKKFYDFIAGRNLADVPVSISSAEDPWKTFGGAFRARAWRSWRGLRNLPRGENVRSRGEHEAWIELCREQRVDDADWGYQELLSCDPRDNVSVSGWHDSDYRFYLTTTKVFQTDFWGRIIETIDDPADLQDRTRAILNALQYAGPFEMEFLLDPRTGRYKVIELNPRFWFQNRLASRLSNENLVRRYLGWDLVPQSSRPRKAIWLETIPAIKPLVCLKFPRLLPLLPRAVWSYPLGGGIRFALRCKREAGRRRG